MSLQNDPNYVFPQPDVPTNGDYTGNFGKEQLYRAYLPKSANTDLENAAASNKVPTAGKYVFDPATGQYTWIPAASAAAAPAANLGLSQLAGGQQTGTRFGDMPDFRTKEQNDFLDKESLDERGARLKPYADFIGKAIEFSPLDGIQKAYNGLYGKFGNMDMDKTPQAGGPLDTGYRNSYFNPNQDSNPYSNNQLGPGPTTTGFSGSTQNETNVAQQAAQTSGLADRETPAGNENSSGTSANKNGGAIHMATGGIGDLGGYSDGGRLLRGPGDGVSDSIPANIGGKRPARLADGEFVVPARIVSELGNGSTEAGARKLYAMLDRIQAGRKKSIGKGKVATDSRMDKNLPA